MIEIGNRLAGNNKTIDANSAAQHFANYDGDAGVAGYGNAGSDHADQDSR